jgi:hypothetical protein
MGRSRSVELANGRRLEYVVTRKLLRLLGVRETVEIPLDVLDRLGVQTGGTHQFLLFGGSQARGGSRDLRGVFRQEEAALAAFHELRTGGMASWAEVVRLDSHGQHAQRCWFDDARQLAGDSTEAQGRRWWRRP